MKKDAYQLELELAAAEERAEEERIKREMLEAEQFVQRGIPCGSAFDLYAELLIGALRNYRMEVFFPDLTISPETIVAQGCFKALWSIKNILEDDTLEDEECLTKIEKIIEVFQKIDEDAGSYYFSSPPGPIHQP